MDANQRYGVCFISYSFVYVSALLRHRQELQLTLFFFIVSIATPQNLFRLFLMTTRGRVTWREVVMHDVLHTQFLDVGCLGIVTVTRRLLCPGKAARRRRGRIEIVRGPRERPGAGKGERDVAARYLPPGEQHHHEKMCR